MQDNLSVPKIPLNLDPRGVETISLKDRLKARLRGEQTLRRMRKLGLRAHPPIRVAGRTVIDPDFAWAVEIGAYSILAHDVRIVAHDAATKRLVGYAEVRPVKIGERCYIGAGAIILPGVVLGDDVIVGAGTIVRGKIPSGSVVVGNPGEIVGSVDDLRDRHLENLESSPCFDRWPREIGPAEIAEMLPVLTANKRIYVL